MLIAPSKKSQRHIIHGLPKSAICWLCLILFCPLLFAQTPDADGDGIPNTVESNVSLNPNDAADSFIDLDGDGWSNADEYRFGTDINDVLDNPASQTNPHYKIFASHAEAYDAIGYSVSVSGDTAVIGAYLDDVAGSASGSVYVFTRNGLSWNEQAKLVANDAAGGDWFGQSVSVSEDTIVIGALYDDDSGLNSGSVYVFTRNESGWSQQAKLVASDAASGDWFGYGVSLSGNTVVVGAPNDDVKGAAYVFSRSGSVWNEQAKLIASDAAANDAFGASVSISENTVVIGSFYDDDAGPSSGSAYVYTRNDFVWSEQAKLVAGDTAADDWFGFSVSVSADTAVIGALYDDDAGSGSGAAYVFARHGSEWNEQAKLVAGDGEANDLFGQSVSVSGSTAVIGALYDDGAGSAYVFVRNGSEWSEQAKLVAGDSTANDEFGQSISVSENTIMVGAYQDDDTGISSGAVYLFELDLDNDGILNRDDPDDDNDGLLDNFEISYGLNPFLGGEESQDPDGDGLTNLEEQLAGTNLNAADTDGDGESDGMEVEKGTDPMSAILTSVSVPAIGTVGYIVLFSLLMLVVTSRSASHVSQ